MKIYLVGGAVRDQLLGLAVNERDWVVVGATENDMLANGFRFKKAGFPVFLHPESNEEYALARRETKIAPGYKGFRFDADSDVSLQEDLRRRDLTINAIAMDDGGNLVDPYGGQDDIRAKMLRHVSTAFAEDPLRILRIARFAARFESLGFSVSHSTFALLKKMSSANELCTLSADRFWRETILAAKTATPQKYFQLLSRCGALAHVLAPMASVIRDEVGEAHGQSLASKRLPLATLSEMAKLTPSAVLRLSAMFLSAKTPAIFETGENNVGLSPAVSDWVKRGTIAMTEVQNMVIDSFSIVRFLEKYKAYARTDLFNELIILMSVCAPDYFRVIQCLQQAFTASSGVKLTSRDLNETTGKGRAVRLTERRIALVEASGCC